MLACDTTYKTYLIYLSREGEEGRVVNVSAKVAVEFEQQGQSVFWYTGTACN
jgi:hypothetical protein